MDKGRIMIVEDEIIVASDIETSLESMGYDVCAVVTSGEEAIIKAETEHPHLILMDITLRGKINGIQAAGEIRERFNIPVIYLTAYGSNEILKQAKITEPFGYILKPFEDRELYAVIEISLYKAEMEERLRKSEEMFRTVSDFTYNWETWRGTDGNYIYVSPSCERITGYKREEFFNDPFLKEKIAHLNDREAVCNHFHNYSELERVGHIEFRILNRNGEERWISHYCQPVYDSKGNFTGRRSSNCDITRQKTAEKELLKIKKFEASGIFAEGIIHDFNNLIFIISGNIDLAKMDIYPDLMVSKYLEKATETCMRAKDLIQRFFTFATGGAPIKRTASVKDVIKNAVNLDWNDFTVKYEYSLPDNLWHVKADPRQLIQVIHNILENAKEAMRYRNGTVKISAANIDTDSISKETFLLKQDKKYVKISITDHGIGIPEKDMEKLFDPYFSTKDKSFQKGMGMGLAVVYSIVKQHEGYVHVESEEGAGTAVHLYLPAFSE